MKIIERENSPGLGLLTREGGPARSKHPHRLAAAIILAITGCLLGGRLQASVPLPGDPPTILDTWPFADTNWLTSNTNAPVAFTNLVNVPERAGHALQLDSTNAAFLQYHVVETNGSNNLMMDHGSLTCWFQPNWSSTNQGGAGPGGLGRLIEVGAYTSDASVGWWSLYFDQGGTNLWFSGQTNNGTGSNFVSAPISWTTNGWHMIALTYSSSNSAIYVDGGLASTNGPGLGVGCYPGPGVRANGMFIGSDSNGVNQAHGQFSNLATYNYQLGSNDVSSLFVLYQIFYDNVTNNQFNTNAPFYPSPDATGFGAAFDVVSGPGWLQHVGSSGTCVTNGRYYMTNLSAAFATNRTMNLTFSIAGGTNGVLYDVFGTSPLSNNIITNMQWVWLGQGYTCNTYTLTNQPTGSAFYTLGSPQDTDHDGLTDAYELMVSKTDPNNPNSYGGLPDGWLVLNGLTTGSSVAGLDPDLDDLTNRQEYLYGTRPLVSEGFTIWVASPGLNGP